MLDRKAWPSIIDASAKYETTTWDKLLAKGFIVKDAKFQWTAELNEQLHQALKDIAKDPQIVHVKDIYYWISHYKFNGMIPVKHVKKKVVQLLQEQTVNNGSA